MGRTMSRIIKSTLLATTALFASYCSNNTHFAGDGGHVDQENQNNGESLPEKIERPIFEPTITPTATPKVVLIPGEYRLSASTTKFIPEVDAYILVDDSSSMAQMQTTLSKAIEKLVIDLAGYKVNFIVRPFSHANNTSVTLAPTAVPSPSPVPMASISMIKYELPSVASFAINENLDAAEIAIVNDRLIAAIKAAGVAGSNTEVGLCLLVRTLKNMSADKPAAFVILSDENDFSAADNSCLD